jgi:hypothetical protein
LLDPKYVPLSTTLSVVSEKTEDLHPGTAWLDKSSEGRSQRILIACASLEEDLGALPNSDRQEHLTWLEVRTVKPKGKKEMPVKEWWNGLSHDVKVRNRVVLDATPA